MNIILMNIINSFDLNRLNCAAAQLFWEEEEEKEEDVDYN